MRALRATIALAVVSACGSLDAPAPPPPGVAWREPPPADLCSLEPDLTVLAPAVPRPPEAAPRGRSGASGRPRAVLLFGVDPAAVRTPAPFVLGERAPRRETALETAFQVVRELRRDGVARVDLPAGTLGLHVSGDRASVVLSGKF